MGPRLSSRARFSSTDKRVSTCREEENNAGAQVVAGPSRKHVGEPIIIERPHGLPSRNNWQKSIRGISLRQVRLVTGMMLFAYLVSHFLNHALGNVSMEALARGVYIHTLFWQSLPVAVVFYTACLVHAGLGIWALYERRQFKWKAMEPIQLVLGLSIPALIIAHIVGVRLVRRCSNMKNSIRRNFSVYFVAAPIRLWMMFAVLVIAWVARLIGLYFWLRMRAFYRAPRRSCWPPRC